MTSAAFKAADVNAWEPGMWDPDAKNIARQWWETSTEQAAFTNALRKVLGLDPLPCPGRRAL